MQHAIAFVAAALVALVATGLGAEEPKEEAPKQAVAVDSALAKALEGYITSVADGDPAAIDAFAATGCKGKTPTKDEIFFVGNATKGVDIKTITIYGASLEGTSAHLDVEVAYTAKVKDFNKKIDTGGFKLDIKVDKLEMDDVKVTRAFDLVQEAGVWKVACP